MCWRCISHDGLVNVHDQCMNMMLEMFRAPVMA